MLDSEQGLNKVDNKVFSLLFSCCLIGWAWKAFFYDLPIEEIVLDEEHASFWVQKLSGLSWTEFVENGLSETIINTLMTVLAVTWAAGSIAVWWYRPIWTRMIVGANAILLLIMASLFWKQQFFQLPQFFEYLLLWVPLLYFAFYKLHAKSVLVVWKISTAAVFIAHGLYAVNSYPLSGEWVQMVIDIFPIGENSAKRFIFVMGVLDLVMAGCLFFRPTVKIALIYCIAWGFLTALARLVCHIPEYQDLGIGALIKQNFPEILVRLPNGGIPFLLYRAIYKPIAE